MHWLRAIRDGLAPPSNVTTGALIRHRVVALLDVGLAVLLTIRAVEDLISGELFSAVTLSCGVAMAIGSLFVLALRGDARLAASLMMVGGYGMLGAMLLGGHSLWGTTYTYLPVTILLAALLIGPRATLGAGLVNMLLLMAMYVLHAVGLRASPIDPVGTLEIRLFDGVLLNGLVVLGAAGFSAVQRDVLQRLEAHSRALERENEERRRAEAQAQEAMEARTRFLASVSHELRTPLHGVIGAARLIEAEHLPSEQQDLLITVQTSADLLLQLIDEVLNYARLDAGRLELEAVPVQVEALLRDVAAPMAILAHDNGVTVHTRLDPDTPAWVLGDPTRLRQILVNLAGNAVKFTQQGQVQLTAAPEPDGLRLEVRDTGQGMSPDQVERLFEPFVQAESTTYRKHGGSGLGMAIVRKLVELMQGRIEVHSTPGAGTRVSLHLPLAPARAPTVDSPLSAPDTRVPRRVLVVDDNPVNRTLARVTLCRAGHQVLEAVDGLDALDVARAHPVDLVLMDCQMPRMDGFEAARELRTLPGMQGVPILALTAATRQETLQKAQQAGMHDVLTKPLAPTALLDAVDTWGEARVDEQATG